MAPRISGASPVFLPFLYPSAVLRPVKKTVALVCPSTSLTSLAIRCHVTETSSAAPSSPAPSSRLNPDPDDYRIASFADKAKLHIHAGAGGNGCISFLREAYLPEGPANGGDGGPGGNIYIQAVHGETSLHKLARRRLVRASRGRHGQGSNKAGQRGDDVIITVPVGTVVRELGREDPEAEEALLRRARRHSRRLMLPAATEDGAPPAAEEEVGNEDLHKWVLYPGISSSEAKRLTLPRLPRRDRLFAQPPGPIYLDLSRPTPRPILLAAGGIGGLGNPHFVSRQTPRPLYATKGDRAVSMEIELELKLLADVGLVGLPNAGKSTLVRALTNSRARVGSWEFTTLQPNIGTVVLDNNRGRPLVTSFRRQALPATPDDAVPGGAAADGEDGSEVVRRTRFTIADIPGLIEGAHLDRGLGIAFLRHVERAGVLAFVVDLSAGDAVAALRALWTEVGLYAQMREEEERDRERDSRIDWNVGAAGPPQRAWGGPSGAGPLVMADYQPPEEPAGESGLHIAAKPWFVVATKGDLPGTQDNFRRLRDYLGRVTRGEEPHPSGVEGAWTKDCAAIPVSAIHGQGVDRIIHWTVGLLDE
ncbi:Obg family GTPase CgtA [Pleurostoma richardsiae]|uniref:Obg family GTPase CgtA n=1 Tax=Pleurostoma richardsiae TaxID=41990 RepID=A0AA38R671_9PEZI|nr:Obg family GTPase CgtA [Pleurostoma richardsiae]